MKVAWYTAPPKAWPDYGTRRDSQRGKLYKAERLFRQKYPGKRIEKIPDIHRWIIKLSQHAWFKKRFNHYDAKHLRIEDGRGRRQATGGHYNMCLPRWARNEVVILHELSHCLHSTSRRAWHNDNEGRTYHGRRYARIFLCLIKHVMGYEAKQHLKECFKQYNVKSSMNKNFSSEQRQAARQRLKNEHCR